MRREETRRIIAEQKLNKTIDSKKRKIQYKHDNKNVQKIANSFSSYKIDYNGSPDKIKKQYKILMEKFYNTILDDKYKMKVFFLPAGTTQMRGRKDGKTFGDKNLKRLKEVHYPDINYVTDIMWVMLDNNNKIISKTLTMTNLCPFDFEGNKSKNFVKNHLTSQVMRMPYYDYFPSNLSAKEDDKIESDRKEIISRLESLKSKYPDFYKRYPDILNDLENKIRVLKSDEPYTIKDASYVIGEVGSQIAHCQMYTKK